MPTAGKVEAVAFFLLDFHRQVSGQWDLAANGASETQNRTQDAGDIVQYLAIETDCTIVVVKQTETREIQEPLIFSPSVAVDD